MSLREKIEAMRSQLDPDAGITAVAYCTQGCGDIDASTVEGETHGACPGPVIVVEHNPDAKPRTVEGRTHREPPPCERCFSSTAIQLHGEPAERERSLAVEPIGEDGRPTGEKMTLCLRCLAALLAHATPAVRLVEVGGSRMPWLPPEGD